MVGRSACVCMMANMFTNHMMHLCVYVFVRVRMYIICVRVRACVSVFVCEYAHMCVRAHVHHT